MTADDFHPDLRRVARWLPRAPVSRRTLPVIRALTALSARRPAGGVAVEPVGPVSVRVFRPPAGGDRLPALLWIHGGGFVLGSAVQDDGLCRRFARTLGIVVVSVEYRLAPDHPFPVPLHDCYEALAWVAGREYVDPARIAIGGASAGGGLAAALALLARQRGEIEPVLQLLSYPMLDDRTVRRSDIDERRFRLWNNRANRFGWQSYTGRSPGSDGIDELAAPARCTDLAHVAPAWIGVGTLDLFYDEDVAYAERLRQAGVPCDLHVVPGTFHGFDSVRPRAGVSEAFRQAQEQALAAALS